MWSLCEQILQTEGHEKWEVSQRKTFLRSTGVIWNESMIPDLGWWGKGILGVLAIQPSLIDEFQVSERLY